MPLSPFDRLLLHDYDRKHYNCLHFTIEAWQILFNQDISWLLKPLIGGPKNEQISDLTTYRQQDFKPIKTPSDNCLVLCRTCLYNEFHIGIIYKGKFLHICEEGVFYLPLELAQLGLIRMTYYEYRPNNN